MPSRADFRPYLNVFTVMASIATLQVATSLLGLTIPIALHERGLGAGAAGLVAAAYALGFALGAWFSPRILSAFGHIRAYAALAAIGAVATLMLDYGTATPVWMALRLVAGFAAAVLFSAAESWINASTPNGKRGRVMGAYQVANKCAQGLGPYFSTVSAGAATAVTTATAFFCASLIPMCFTKGKEPEPPSAHPLSVRALWHLAPAAVLGVFIAGLINAAGLALAPIVVIEAGGTKATAATLIFSAQVASMIIQWPAARLSDSIDRRLVVLVLALGAAVASALLAVYATEAPDWRHMALFAFWGGSSFSFYGLCTAHAADRAHEEGMNRDMGKVASGLLFIWATGAIIGPAVGGFVMNTPFGAGAVFVFTAAGASVLVLFLIARLVLKRAPKAWLRFIPAPPTTPVAASGKDDD